MTNRDAIKTAIEQDKLAEWLDRIEYCGSPWDRWFDRKYCRDCPVIPGYYEGKYKVSLGYCDIHDHCKYFPELGHAPSGVDVIKWWLDSEEEDDGE